MSRNILELKQYENRWVALTYPNNQVVGSGNTLAEAKHEAHKRGHEKPILFKVPRDAYYIPSL